MAPCFQRHVAVGKVGPSGALLSGAVSSCGSAHLPPRQGAPGLPKPEVDLLCPGTRAGRPPSFLREARGGCCFRRQSLRRRAGNREPVLEAARGCAVHAVLVWTTDRKVGLRLALRSPQASPRTHG